MPITNGTFDTDLSGWTASGDGTYSIQWDTGRARLRVYKCSDASLSQTITVDNNTLLFDYQSTSDQWSEITYFRLMRDQEVLVSIPLLYTTVNAPINVSASVSLDVSSYVGQTVTLVFAIEKSPYCNNDDHQNTYIYVDNVRIIHSAEDIVVSESDFTVVPDTCEQLCDATVNVTWTNNGNLNGLIYPAITVDGTRIPFSMPESILAIAPGAFVTKSFTVQNLGIGQHEICPSPNSGVTCKTISVESTVYAKSIVPTPSTCSDPCSTNIDVTYTNSGTLPEIFTPEITVNGTHSTLAPDTLDPSTDVLKTFPLTGLTVGTYSVCAIPPGTTTCQTITVNTPANIVPIVIIPSVTTCTAPCDLTVDVTYTNIGQTSGTFIPEITLDGTSSTLTSDTLGASQSVVKTFPLTGLTTGTYSICTKPLGNATCQSITVTKVAEAGIGILLAAGLAFGLLFMGGKKEEKTETGRKGKVESFTIKQ